MEGDLEARPESEREQYYLVSLVAIHEDVLSKPDMEGDLEDNEIRLLEKGMKVNTNVDASLQQLYSITDLQVQVAVEDSNNINCVGK